MGWSLLGSKEYLDWFNDTGKTLSYSIQYKSLLNTSLAAQDLFPMFTQSINFYVLKNVIHHLERNEWLLLSAFVAKIGFCLNTGKCLFIEVSF